MPLNGHGDLAIVELIFYTPALALALWVAARHGFSKQAGWISLAILPFIRIIGSAMLLASEYHPSNGLIEGATALENVGLSPLLLAMLALLKRVNESMPNRLLPPRIFNLMGTPLVVAPILGIISATDIYSSDPSDRATGKALRHAAVILYVICYIAQVAITFLALPKARELTQGEARLLVAIAISTPFLASRLLYSVIGAFASTSSIFNPVTGSAILLGLMAILMEFIVVVLYLAAGFVAPVIRGNQVRSQGAEHATPLYNSQGRDGHQDPQQQQQQRQRQRSRNETAYTIARHIPVVRLFVGRFG